jgi:hypothetical protein
MIVSSEYEDYVCLLELTWVDWMVDIEMAGFEYEHVEANFWLYSAPQLPWHYEPVPEELIQKVMARIKEQAEKERKAESMAKEAQKGRSPLD